MVLKEQNIVFRARVAINLRRFRRKSHSHQKDKISEMRLRVSVVRDKVKKMRTIV